MRAPGPARRGRHAVVRRRAAAGVGRRRRGAARRPPPARRRPQSASLAARASTDPVEDGDALVVATSGYDRRPKAAVLTHAAVAASALATSARLGVDPARDRWLACLPLAHVGGLGVVTRALLTGTALTVHDGFDAPAVEAAGVTAARSCRSSPTALVGSTPLRSA